jgi:hypothetical protein
LQLNYAPLCALLQRSVQMPRRPDDPVVLPLVERLRIVPLAEAARLSGISEDSLRRHHSSKLIRLSPRRIGMRQGDALLLSEIV